MWEREEHIIGEVIGEGRNQLIIAIGGMHGNERGGIQAIERVIKVLNSAGHSFHGKLIGLRGNPRALEQNVRFLHSDLNRIWTKDDLDFAYTEFDPLQHAEHLALRHLHELIESEASEYDEVVIVDFHTTSAIGGVFIACPDEEINKRLVRRLHVPVILNLARDLAGTAMQYYWDKNLVAFAFEGGNHYAAEAIDKMESSLWLILEFMQCIDRHEFDNVEYHDLRLIHATEGLPHFCKLIGHHKIHVGDDFKMLPGFKNFQRIHRGQHLADDAKGAIYAQTDGLILMPLYQEKGSDGFFIIEELLQHSNTE